MAEVLTPPEGQNSFSGIPKAEFVEDVDSYMKGEDSAETKLKVSCIHTIYIKHTCRLIVHLFYQILGIR